MAARSNRSDPNAGAPQPGVSIPRSIEPAGSAGGLTRELFVTLGWPAAAAVSLSISLAGREATAAGLVLVGCGTAAAYGLDRWIDRRGVDSTGLRRWLAVSVGMAALGTAALACTAWWRFQVCLLVSLIAGAYVPLKRVLPKNVMTTVAWTLAAATLPFGGPPPWDPSFAESVVSVACIMAANTTLCDIPDFAADRQARVRGITPWLGPKAGAVAAVVFGVLGAGTAGWAGRWGLALTSVTLGVLAVFLGRSPSNGVFRRLADVVVTVVPGPVALLFR